jgi:hypothetical protein
MPVRGPTRRSSDYPAGQFCRRWACSHECAPGIGTLGVRSLAPSSLIVRAQLRRDGPVVLDGVARAPEIALARAMADEETARLVEVMTHCSDAGIHRSRVVGSQRGIPNWYELDWQQVERARDGWEPISSVDITVGATEPLTASLAQPCWPFNRLLGD